jgi:small subunit ribosomal protein S17
MEAKKKTKVGRVVSDRMKKTVVVAVDSRKRHPLYGKLFKRTLKYKSHDEKDQCKLGDTVRIEESRPISKEKRWRVAEILNRGETAASE